MCIWAFGISEERCKSLSKWDYTKEYKLSLEEEKSLKYIEKRRPITAHEEEILKEIRETYGNGNPVSKYKNVAYSNGKIGDDIIDLRCVSGKNGVANFDKIAADNYHYTGIYGKSYINHTVQDIIEFIYNKYKNNTFVSGYINIISERCFCPNCASIIEQFENDFPNIVITWIFERL